MKEINFNNNNCLFIELVESFSSYELFGSLISTTEDINEDEFENIVGDYYLHTEYGDDLYKNFQTEIYMLDYSFRDSLHSFIKFIGLDITKNYLIINRSNY